MQPEGSPARVLLELLYNPLSEGKPLAYLCEQAELSFEDLVDLCEKYHISMGRLAWAPHLPDVLTDVAVDAKSSINMCGKCYGTGRKHSVRVNQETGGESVVQLDLPCATCNATGHVRKSGDKQARLLLFEAWGLVGKAKGPLVAIQQNVTVGADQASKVTFAQKLLGAGRKTGS